MELLAHENGVLVRGEHRAIAAQLDYAVRTGQLQAALPGIYVGREPDVEVKVRAASAFRPGCIVTGAAAARLLWWPEVPVTAITCAVTQSVPGRYRGFEWERRAIPPELVAVRDGVRIAAPAVSVLDLIPALGGAVIDEALRRGAVTLGELTAALKALGRRPGNALRTELLRDSRDEPWSEAERAAHRLLRAEGLTGWRTNRSVRALGADYVVDIVFRTRWVVIEIDGWQFHGDREAFRRDRWRYARLAAGGWTVLPFAAAAVQEEPAAFIEVVRAALEGGEF